MSRLKIVPQCKKGPKQVESWPSKDPDEILDYLFNWTARLVTGETISTSVMLLASGTVTLGVATIVGTTTKVWISGGTAGGVSVVTNRITTSASRTYEESAKLRIRSSV